MAENAHTLAELRQLQALPLEAKFGLTFNRVRGWLQQHDAFVSFSGGLDSKVVRHIARQVRPSIPSVFLNTRTEHRSIIAAVRATENVEEIRPDITFAKAVEKYGWCVPYKEVAGAIYEARAGGPAKIKAMQGLNGDGTHSDYRSRVFKPYAYLMDAPFLISDFCCDALKKHPMDKYCEENYTTPILGTRAEESPNRRTSWLKNGCNGWDMERPASRPISFWTKQDVLQYIQLHNLPIPSVYGEIVEDEAGGLRCTGQDRTGCQCCPVGAKKFSKNQLSKFELMARDDPMYHAGLMRSRMGLREVLLAIDAPLGCTACGGRCYCGADPNAPRYKGECKQQLKLRL